MLKPGSRMLGVQAPRRSESRSLWLGVLRQSALPPSGAADALKPPRFRTRRSVSLPGRPGPVSGVRPRPAARATEHRPDAGSASATAPPLPRSRVLSPALFLVRHCLDSQSAPPLPVRAQPPVPGVTA
ncbi:hypothetical protein HJG60_011614 [Phyllostomus discolor]|uniref:Uncharacterized protein n=1 Tax=Phyllostomus discolor TaxID=89673 RepID=A0A833ZYD6_9CHIR|nr:hypothetical protein HJG60_011614 [Phyllostomus discolor]